MCPHVTQNLCVPYRRTGGAIQVPHIGVSFVTLGLPLAALPATVGGGNIAMAPIAHSNENEITDIASMEETNNALQEAMERYAAENERLKQVVKKIEEQVNGMQQSQDALDTITKQQTSSIDEFEEQVKLQKQLVEELKKDKQSGVIQGLLTIIVSSDTDGDFKIDDEEIDGLIEKIEGMGELGVNRELFEQKIKEKKGNFQVSHCYNI